MNYDYSTNYTYDLPTSDASGGLLAGIGIGFILVYVVLIAIMIVSMWKMFSKAGKPGWASIVPIYNAVVMLQMVGRPVWWLLLYFVPIANIIVGVIVTNDLAKSFGKDVVWTLGLLFLPFVFYPILAFGDAKYVGPGGAHGAAPHTGAPVRQ